MADLTEIEPFNSHLHPEWSPVRCLRIQCGGMSGIPFPVVLGVRKGLGIGTSPGALRWQMTHQIVELEVILEYLCLDHPSVGPAK